MLANEPTLLLAEILPLGSQSCFVWTQRARTTPCSPHSLVANRSNDSSTNSQSSDPTAVADLRLKEDVCLWERKRSHRKLQIHSFAKNKPKPN